MRLTLKPGSLTSSRVRYLHLCLGKDMVGSSQISSFLEDLARVGVREARHYSSLGFREFWAREGLCEYLQCCRICNVVSGARCCSMRPPSLQVVLLLRSSYMLLQLARLDSFTSFARRSVSFVGHPY